MTTAIYLRMSEDRTGDELGIDRQRRDCRALADRNGWTVTEYSDNDISATKGKHRPGYTALMAAVERGEVERIVVFHTSRLWRNRKERADGIDRLQRARVSVVAAKGPTLDMTTAYGRGMAGLVGEFDTMESEVKSERQIAKAAQLARDGLPAGGRRAFGYTADGMHLVADEAEAVRAAYAALIDQRRSLVKLAADLNRSFTTTMGNAWRHGTVRGMLLNPRNAAIRVHVEPDANTGQPVTREYPAKWPAIVSEDVYRAAVALLTEPKRKTNGVGFARKWLGTRLFRCGRDGCGELLRCTYREQGRRVYRCDRCHLSRRADFIDSWVELLVEERLARPDLADLLAPVQGIDDDALAALRTEAAALRIRHAEAFDMWKAGEITRAEMTAARADIDEKLAAIEAQTEAANSVDPAAAVLRAPDPVAAWRAADDVALRQAVIRRLMTVTLLPGAMGGAGQKFDEASVLITVPEGRPL